MIKTKSEIDLKYIFLKTIILNNLFNLTILFFKIHNVIFQDFLII